MSRWIETGLGGTGSNHGRLPDSWEHAHHPSLDRTELRHGSDPTDSDTDDDSPGHDVGDDHGNHGGGSHDRP